ncbi:MAG: pyridoxal phosphate-dependent aminotransferase [Kiloniellales bacterium]
MTVSRLAEMPGIGVDRMGAAADAAAAANPALLRLENLDTDLRPPPAAIAATREAAGRDEANSYLPFLGQHALRRAVAAHVGRLSGVAYDSERQCIITAGGLSGCLIALLALLEPGDEVVLTDPTYVGMLNRVRLAGGRPHLAPFVRDGAQLRLDLDALCKAFTPRTGGRTRAAFIMSPSMPSGAVLNHQEWQAIAALCQEHDAWLLYNAAMERILYDGRPHIHPAGLPGMAERTITVGSASKEFRMIGWRVGWVVGPEAIMRDIALASISDVVVPVGIAQEAARAALETPEQDVTDAVAEWQRRRDVIVEELAGLPLIPAAGSWSMLLDAGALGHGAADASALLLERGAVAATPMAGWGEVNGPQFVRFVFSNEPAARLRGLGERLRRALT